MDGLSLTDLLILALATLYLSFALTKTHGAFGMFAWIRQRLPLGGATSCIVCAAFWMALAMYIVWLTPLRPLVDVLALAGGATMAAYYVGMAQWTTNE